MGLKIDAQPTPSRISGLTDEEERQLRQAEDDLRRAQEAYDALAPLRQKRALLKRSERHRNRRPPTEVEQPADDTAAVRSARERRLRYHRRAQERLFFNSFQQDASIEQSSDDLVSLFREIGSLDQFAKHLETTRRNAIHALKAAGVDVLEDIAKQWENKTSLRRLSEQHGPTPQTISKWIKSTGRQIKPRNSNRIYDETTMHALFRQKWTINSIAEAMKLSWATVQKCYEAWWRAQTERA